MEKRAYVRQPVNFQATLVADSIKDQQVQVKDFCFGGMLVCLDSKDFTRNPNLTTLIRNDQVTIKVNLPDLGHMAAGEYQQGAKIARVDGLNIGIAFVNPNASTIAGIQQLAKLDSSDQEKYTATEFKSNDSSEHSHFDKEARRIATGKYGEAEERKILKSTLQVIEEYLEKETGNFLTELQKDLQKSIDNARDNAEQNELFDGVNKFSKYSEKMGHDIAREASLPFQDYALRNSFDLSFLKKDSGSQKISLIGKDDFEDWLVVKVMATKVETENTEPLQELQIRFHELSGLAMGVQNNPISPAVICNAFNKAASLLPIDNKIRKIIYGSFEKHVAGKLSELYAAINKHLDEQGILQNFELLDHIDKIGGKRGSGNQKASPAPQAEEPTEEEQFESFQQPNTDVSHPAQTPQNRAPSASNGSPAGASPAQESPQTPGSPDQSAPIAPLTGNPYIPVNDVGALENSPSASYNAEIYREQLKHPASEQYQQINIQQQIARNAAYAVKNLISNHKSTNTGFMYSHTPAPDFNIPAYESSKVSQTLRALQATELSPEAEGSRLSERLQDALQDGEDEEKRLGDSEAAALNIIERLFDSILDLENINEDIYPWIKKLEIPFLKLLLKDEGFLQDLDHPARQVLNTVAKLGRRGVMNNDNNVALVNKSLKHIVEEFDTDISVFNSANHDLNGLLERQEKIYNKNLDRVKEAAQGQFRIKAAKRFVDNTLEDALTERDIPAALATLLDAGWRDLMDITIVKEGADSKLWTEYEGVLHTLIQILNPDRKLPDLKVLLTTIKSGLNSISPNGQFSDQRTIDELKKLLTAKRTRNSVDAAVINLPKGTFSSSAAGREDEIEAVWIKRARRLTIGDWLEVDSDAEIFTLDGDQADDDSERKITKAQMRLAWHDEGQEEYVFVNHQGSKVIDIDVYILANMLKQEKAVLIEDQNQPVVDLGLDKMVHNFYDELLHHASHDELTGLRNRREFERQLKLSITEARQEENEHAMALIDFDQIEEINKECGFEAGDELLKAFANVILKNTPKNTVAARFAGDQYAILLPRVNRKTSSVLFANLKKQLSKFTFNWQDSEFKSHCSLGLVAITKNSENVSKLLERARQACENAKEKRNESEQINIVESEEVQGSEEFRSWLDQIDSAISDNRLALNCQRITSLQDPEIQDQYEVLLDIKDEGGNSININDFLHAAETGKKMQLLDRWVIKNTLAWMQSEPEKVASMSGCDIRLSGHSLNDEELLYFIFENLVEQNMVPRPKVCFEVAESTAVKNVSDLSDFVNEMQNIGCQFSLDDFGSESSSYSFLKNLPLNYVKIDEEFVKHIAESETDLAVLKSMNEMVHFLGKKTIAKGVNDARTMEVLKEIGVDFAQGNYIEAPTALTSLEISSAAA